MIHQTTKVNIFRNERIKIHFIHLIEFLCVFQSTCSSSWVICNSMIKGVLLRQRAQTWCISLSRLDRYWIAGSIYWNKYLSLFFHMSTSSSILFIEPHCLWNLGIQFIFYLYSSSYHQTVCYHTYHTFYLYSIFVSGIINQHFDGRIYPKGKQ